MSSCVIFCAGEFDALAEPIQSEDVVIAADGGLRHAQQLNIQPYVILGDFDSLGYIPQKSQVFPVEKDDTDSMLAAKHGLELGCDRFVLYGALEGPRLDHSLANFQTLGFLANQGAKAVLAGKDCMVAVLRNGEMTLPALEEGIVSVFCLGADAKGVTIEGLKYSLTQGTLTAGFPLGISNHFIGTDARICVEEGTLLVFYPREAGVCI